MKKYLTALFVLLASPAIAQVNVAPAVAPTSGTPSEAEIDNAYGICQAHRVKGGWQSGYESCDAVQKAFAARIDETHRQTMLGVATRLKK